MKKNNKLSSIAADFAADFIQRNPAPLDEFALIRAFCVGAKFQASSYLMWHVVDTGCVPKAEPNRYAVLVFLNGLAKPIVPDVRVVRTSECSEYFSTSAVKPFAWAYFDRLFPLKSILLQHVRKQK